MRATVSWLAAACVLVAGGASLTGCASEAEPAWQCGERAAGALPCLPEAPAYAVVLSDYDSTAIAMLDAEGTPLDDAWLTSGTQAPGLVAALSGDVVLPSVASGRDTLFVLDRFTTDVVTRVDVLEGTIVGQVRTQDPMSAVAWASNPRDLVVVREDLAWVSRFEPNPDPGAAPLERGTDLYAIDPSTMTRLGMRIDLSQYDTTVTTREGATAIAHARPSSIVRVGGVLLVGLARLTLAFDGAAEGAIAEVTLATGATRLIELPGLRDCSRIVQASQGSVLVGCAGFGTPTFGEPVSTRASAAIATVTVSGDRAEVTSVLRFGEHPELPVASVGLEAIDAGRALALVWGGFDPPAPDRVLELDLATATYTELATGGAFELGTMTFDPATVSSCCPTRRSASGGSRGARRGATPSSRRSRSRPRSVCRRATRTAWSRASDPPGTGASGSTSRHAISLHLQRSVVGPDRAVGPAPSTSQLARSWTEPARCSRKSRW